MFAVIDRDLIKEKQYKESLHVLFSFPRSGSHWTRRMVGEVLGMRYGFRAEFGEELNKDCGFFGRYINDDDFEVRPQLVATHAEGGYPKDNLRIFLRRDFEQVWRSTQKAQIELGYAKNKDGSLSDELNCWWGGTREECFEKWKKTTDFGCTHAKLVVDYDMTKADPRTTVKAIIQAMGLEPATEEELDAAVQAGSRENMLKEQNNNCEDRHWNIVNSENYDPIKDAGVAST